MPRQPIEVLHLIKCLDRGGAERLLVTTVTTGDPEGYLHEVAFVRTDMRGLVDELADAGTAVWDLGARSDRDLRWVLRLRRLLLARGYDVVHAHLPYAAALARIAVRSLPRRSRPRFVYTEHSMHDQNSRATQALRLLTGRLDDVSLAVAETNRAALPASLRSRTEVVLHGIDLEAIGSRAPAESIRSVLGIPIDHWLVVSVANLTEQKGYPILLRTARDLLDRGLPVTFLAAGAGPLERALVELRDELGLGDRFRFLGQRADAVDLIAAADLLVLASHWECMPVAVMEAFAVGTPVVVTASGDLPRHVQPGHNGLLVRPGDGAGLTEAIDRVLRDDHLRARLARGAQESAATFDARRTTRELESIYARLAGP